jgi:hypothetical protein
MVFSTGTVAGASSVADRLPRQRPPIPGGIGILDGGIVGALVLYHTPAASAAAVLPDLA